MCTLRDHLCPQEFPASKAKMDKRPKKGSASSSLGLRVTHTEVKGYCTVNIYQNMCTRKLPYWKLGTGELKNVIA